MLYSSGAHDSVKIHPNQYVAFKGCSEVRYRKTLEDGLAYLEQQLTALGWSG